MVKVVMVVATCCLTRGAESIDRAATEGKDPDPRGARSVIDGATVAQDKNQRIDIMSFVCTYVKSNSSFL